MDAPEYTELRRILEDLAQRQLVQAADLRELLDRMDRRLALAEQTQRDMRLTLTGIGALAQRLTERMEGHEAILRSLTAILTSQQQRNEHQDTLNERLAAAIERLDVTQARIETLLARMIPPSENGREA